MINDTYFTGEIDQYKSSLCMHFFTNFQPALSAII